MNQLSTQFVIENVVRDKIRGKVFYQSSFSAIQSDQLIRTKPFDHPSGKGYQRPAEINRCLDFAKYLSKGDCALFPPVLLNAASNWEFINYDTQRPNFGRLYCKGPAFMMDGQHRVGGIKQFIRATQMEMNIPFLAFHYLDEDEEIFLFDTINTKAKGIGTSLSKYLRRDTDKISWVSTELLIRKESPFFGIGTIIGKRSKNRHVTLQNIYRFITSLTKNSVLSELTKEELLNISIVFFNSIKACFPLEWADYKNYRLCHIVVLDALSLAGKVVLEKLVINSKKQLEIQKLEKPLTKLSVIDWSSEGPLKYVRGANGAKQLSKELMSVMGLE